MADPQQPEERPAPSDPPELEDHPGRPRRSDEIDPELMRLPRPRPKIGWLLSLSVVVLCGYVMLKLRSDLVFSRQPDAAQAIARIDDLFAQELDTYVSIHAVPDRAYAMRARRSHQRLYPVLGTDGRLWLLLPGSAWAEGPIYKELYTGRLKRIDDLPVADALSEHLAAQDPAPRYLSADEIRNALSSRSSRIQHASGDPVELSPATELTIARRDRDRARVIAVRTDEYPDEASWRAALIRNHLIDRDAGPESGDEQTWRYLVSGPASVESINEQLKANGLGAARAEPVVETPHAPWSEVIASERGLTLRGTEVGWDEIVQAWVTAKRHVAPGARVIVVAEKPEEYWYVLPLFGVLSLSALAFGWALVRALRGDQSAREPAASAAA